MNVPFTLCTVDLCRAEKVSREVVAAFSFLILFFKPVSPLAFCASMKLTPLQPLRHLQCLSPTWEGAAWSFHFQLEGGVAG